MSWPDTRLLDLFGVDVPILLAPMANFAGLDMALAVADAGALAALPCAALNAEQIKEAVARFRAQSSKPLNLNFFCHAMPEKNVEKERAWLARIAPYFDELGVPPPSLPLSAGHPPFAEAACGVIEDLKPEIVSFHFGLPQSDLLARVKATGCKLLSTATTLREAEFLQAHGVDAIIAQGAEAGGHRGMFLETDVSIQVGTFALVRAISARVGVPVIAAGGIADGRAIAASFALGASAAQIGTAFLVCAESTISPLHRQALADPARETAITNVLTGRPARGIMNRFMRDQGPMDNAAPAFPFARPAIAPLRSKAEERGSTDFSPLWSGQAAVLPQPMNAGALTRKLAEDARASLAPA
jgi:nitronate monooxygenase